MLKQDKAFELEKEDGAKRLDSYSMDEKTSVYILLSASGTTHDCTSVDITET